MSVCIGATLCLFVLSPCGYISHTVHLFPTSSVSGLSICGHNCLLTAEWMSASKIVCRVGPAKNDKGEIIVTTKSGGLGTSTVSFKLLKPERIGEALKTTIVFYLFDWKIKGAAKMLIVIDGHAIKCRKIVKEACYTFPEVKLMSSVISFLFLSQSFKTKPILLSKRNVQIEDTESNFFK